MAHSGLPHDRLDPQRERVYEAESEVWPPEEADLLSLSELRNKLDEIQAKSWFKRLYPRTRRIPLKDGRGEPFSRGGVEGIHIVREARHLDILVHELAHVLAPVNAEWHGSLWAGLELFLVGKVYGGKKKVQLRRAFKRNNVRWDPRVSQYGRIG